MGRGVNKVILIGSLGRDPEMRYMPNGNAVINFTMATDESYKDKQTGQKVDKTEWHRIVAFNKLAEIMGEYLKKGSKVYIEGKLQTREWEKDGVKRYTTEIVAGDMNMLDTKSDSQSAGQQQAPPQQQQPQQSPQPQQQSWQSPQQQGQYHPPQQQQQQQQQPQQQQPQQQQGGYHQPPQGYNQG